MGTSKSAGSPSRSPVNRVSRGKPSWDDLTAVCSCSQSVPATGTDTGGTVNAGRHSKPNTQDHDHGNCPEKNALASADPRRDRKITFVFTIINRIGEP